MSAFSSHAFSPVLWFLSTGGPGGITRSCRFPNSRRREERITSLRYELCGRVESATLLAAERVACLDPFGICLLLQRKVHDEARVVVPTTDFHAACAHVFEEAELLEDWLSAARSAGELDLDAAAVEMHEFLRAPRDSEMSLQEALLDVAKRTHVRRVVRERLEAVSE